MKVVLYNLPWSPPSVRARWALFERGVPYRSVAYAPSTHHALRIRLATGQGSVPVAWIDGEAIAGSTAIARAIDPAGTRGDPLFFDDPALDAEVDAWVEAGDRLFDAARIALGPALQRDRQALLDAVTPGPAWVHWLFPVAWRVAGWDWARRYQVRKIDVDAARAATEAAVLALEERRAGRTWLVGGRFSWADIAIAAYLGIVRPARAFTPPPALGRLYGALAAPGPWDPLFAWRDAMWADRNPDLGPR